jgi:hypothetical protein
VRGLPPVPQDVAFLQAGLENDGARATVGWWLQIPGLASAIPTDIRSTLDLLAVAVEEFINPLTPVSCSVVTCRLAAGGSAPFSLLVHVSANVGAWSSGSDTQVATGVHWETTVARRRGASITHIPWTPDQFTDDHLRLNDTGFDDTANEATDFITQVSTCGVGGIPVVTLGTLYRSQFGYPLPAAIFAPIFFAVPVRLLTTIRRRMNQARR